MLVSSRLTVFVTTSLLYSFGNKLVFFKKVFSCLKNVTGAANRIQLTLKRSNFVGIQCPIRFQLSGVFQYFASVIRKRNKKKSTLLLPVYWRQPPSLLETTPQSICDVASSSRTQGRDVNPST